MSKNLNTKKESTNMETIKRGVEIITYVKPLNEKAKKKGDIFKIDDVIYMVAKVDSIFVCYEATSGMMVCQASKKKDALNKLETEFHKMVKGKDFSEIREKYIKELKKAKLYGIYENIMNIAGVNVDEKPKPKKNTLPKAKKNKEILAETIEKLGIKEEVATYQQWLKQGKIVKKGSKAMFKCLLSMPYNGGFCKRNVAYFGESQVEPITSK